MVLIFICGANYDANSHCGAAMVGIEFSFMAIATGCITHLCCFDRNGDAAGCDACVYLCCFHGASGQEESLLSLYCSLSESLLQRIKRNYLDLCHLSGTL